MANITRVFIGAPGWRFAVSGAYRDPRAWNFRFDFVTVSEHSAQGEHTNSLGSGGASVTKAHRNSHDLPDHFHVLRIPESTQRYRRKWMRLYR